MRRSIAALQLALTQCRAEGADRAEQIDAKLADEPWEDVARFAAYCCQCDRLDLKPWQEPPCHADEDETDPDELHLKDAQTLLRRMLKAGVSRYHPDPLKAIAEAKAAK